VVLRPGGSSHEALFPIEEARAFAPAAASIFLGLKDDAPRFGLGLDSEAIARLQTRSDLKLTDLRTIAVQDLVAAEHVPPLAEAKAVLGWHARHRFCSNCGAPTTIVQAGWRRDCSSCGVEHFPRTDPVVIMLVTAGERCVLGRSRRFAPTMWSCLAGFVEPGESLEEAVRREVLEEAGIVCGKVGYFASQPWPFPSSIMVGFHTQALTDKIVVDREELEDARWFDRAELTQMLKREHPQGLFVPPPVAIAHHIIRRFVEDGPDVLG
jgi:NAD+ diphosphatase